MRRASIGLALVVVAIFFGISGCGGEEAPPPLNEDLRQQIEQEDQQIADGESAL
ncbi:hypothetical protein [Rhodopirellula baltica]|uniref:hypothetical protein n=1 Tax=Rhodopirellula baltica TaxID=265606 RepID=UPI001360B66E|nr:hypothetical protein [Rhodopirellula baltica]